MYRWVVDAELCCNSLWTRAMSNPLLLISVAYHLQGQVDHRLKQQINEKKLAMGLKIENTQKASYQTEEEYEMSM